MYELLADPRTWESLVTLTLLEVVLGIDNVLFLSIISGQLPKSQQRRARGIGLAVALAMRVILLSAIAWVMSLSEPFLRNSGRGRELLQPVTERSRATLEAGEHALPVALLVVGGAGIGVVHAVLKGGMRNRGALAGRRH